MQFSDEGYIIKVLKHGESSAIVTVLSSSYGKVSGFIKGALSKKKLGVYQLGNLISFNAYSRLEENMPQFLGVELVKSNAVNFFNSAKKLNILTSFCELMNSCIADHENLEFLNFYIKDFFEASTDFDTIVKYSFFEYYLLEFLGIGLDLSECAATGSKENLAFISPKSSKAVSYEAGLPYKEKLFKFPHYIMERNYKATSQEVLNVLKMTKFFLTKNFYLTHNIKFPHSRDELLDILKLYDD